MGGNNAVYHTSQKFMGLLGKVVAGSRLQQEIHIILDNLSAHKTQVVREFLTNHPEVQLHFASTCSSWLNRVEIWFGETERDVVSRGIFTSVLGLAARLRRYINAYSVNARPVQWKYADPTHRICTNDLSATGH